MKNFNRQAGKEDHTFPVEEPDNTPHPEQLPPKEPPARNPDIIDPLPPGPDKENPPPRKTYEHFPDVL